MHWIQQPWTILPSPECHGIFGIPCMVKSETNKSINSTMSVLNDSQGVAWYNIRFRNLNCWGIYENNSIRLWRNVLSQHMYFTQIDLVVKAIIKHFLALFVLIKQFNFGLKPDSKQLENSKNLNTRLE